MFRTTERTTLTRVRAGAAITLGLVGAVALAASPATAAPTMQAASASASAEAVVDVGLAIYVDDANPDDPTGATEDGAPSSAELLSTIPADRPVTLSIQLVNEGTVDLDRAFFEDATGRAVWNDQWIYGNGTPRSMHPGETTTFTQTLPAAAAGEVLSGGYSVSAANRSLYGTAEASYALTSVGPGI